MGKLTYLALGPSGACERSRHCFPRASPGEVNLDFVLSISLDTRSNSSLGLGNSDGLGANISVTIDDWGRYLVKGNGLTNLAIYVNNWLICF